MRVGPGIPTLSQNGRQIYPALAATWDACCRDDTCCIAVHAYSILHRLEYFGEHHTSNHLANNGRGLYLIGAILNDEELLSLGGKILTAEIQRIFLPSGVLREGSTHYHALLAKNLVEV